MAVAAGLAPADVLAGLQAMGRDNARTPMQWDAVAGAGFSDGTPWMRQPQPCVAQRSRPVRRSGVVFNHYRRLIALRHDDDVVVDGEFAMLLPDDPTSTRSTRRGSTTALLVLGNFSGETQPVDVPPEWVGATLVLGNYVDDRRPILDPYRRCGRGRRGCTSVERGDEIAPSPASTTSCCAAPTSRRRWRGTSTPSGWRRYASMRRAGAVPFPSVRVSAATIIDLVPATGVVTERTSTTSAWSPSADGRRHRRRHRDVPRDLWARRAIRSAGDGWSVYVHDPDDNVVEIRSYDR